jgi:leucyl-tRNA synthetase
MEERHYPFHEVEPRWQAFWQEIGLYRAPDRPERPKFYVLEMFPYPSGGDLHMGHLKNYAIGDVVARWALMQGYDVLHPMGWDAFGLPAENAAIKYGIHPKTWTDQNIVAYRHHLQLLGISYDWSRELATCWPDYYRWTQWLFLYLYHRGLAYRASEYVNFCPNCKTVLANEQVIDGLCERCKTPVVKKALEQWFFRITAYAERLLTDLQKLEGKWPDHILRQQAHWIGRSEGTEIHFRLAHRPDVRLPVFTTRADTLFGVTFLTIAPEHELLDTLLEDMDGTHRAAVEAYRQSALQKTDVERTAVGRPKTGVPTGLAVVHPYTGEALPLWVSDYVLAHYGTGIVMGVPAHDERDFEFARQYGLPVRPVVRPVDGVLPDPQTMGAAWVEKGIMEASGPFSGLPSDEGIRRIQEDLRARGLGGPAVSYRLRDWLISRQRYWGAPIPVVHCPQCGIVPVPEDQLPVRLPENVQNFLPTGRSPLEDVPAFMETTCPRCAGPARRDPDTMDTFVDSSWYFLRFIDAHNDRAPFDPEKANAWLPVDQYIGGAEHATKHLIYARFITKVLYDGGLLQYDEPFEHLFTQGLVLKRFWWCGHCLRPVEETEARKVQEETYLHTVCETTLESRLEMMSKSRGNVVPVGPFVEKHGADVARIAILFAGPPEKDFEWTDAIVEGGRNFLNRIWRLFLDTPAGPVPTEVDPADLDAEALLFYIRLQKTVRSVREDVAQFRFNTAVAQLMAFLNTMYEFPDRSHPVFRHAWYVYVRLLAPFAPHLAEELWHRLGYSTTVFRSPFPVENPDYLVETVVEIPVQVNGRVRATLRVPVDTDPATVEAMARSHPNVARYLEGRHVQKVVYVPNRLLNFVVS